MMRTLYDNSKPQLLVVGGYSFSAGRGYSKLLRVERYLGRQARAAHNLCVRDLEWYYNVGSNKCAHPYLVTMQKRGEALCALLVGSF